MQSIDTTPISWTVSFRQEQRNCCPPRKYWIVRKEVVEAPSADLAEAEVKRRWRYNHSIEIQSITRTNDEQGK
jgi:hypothetical protein